MPYKPFPKICKMCEQTFLAERPRNMFCSKSCGVRFNNGSHGWAHNDDEFEVLFWCMVEAKRDGCWEWRGTTLRKGYGAWVGRYDGTKYVAVHRYSYAIHFCHPEEMLVCHRCDNPLCVRPDHLFLGTNSDNRQDCVRKGRHSRVYRKAN
jgi:hypothetical protein